MKHELTDTIDAKATRAIPKTENLGIVVKVNRDSVASECCCQLQMLWGWWIKQTQEGITTSIYAFCHHIVNFFWVDHFARSLIDRASISTDSNQHWTISLGKILHESEVWCRQHPPGLTMGQVHMNAEIVKALCFEFPAAGANKPEVRTAWRRPEAVNRINEILRSRHSV